jgi:hypothetical protein
LKSARNTLPEEPVNAVTCGIDWARDDHAVSVVDARGREIRRCTIEHSAAGLRELLAVLARAGAAEVAIERAGGPFAGALPGGGIIVVVISPNQVRNLRGRLAAAPRGATGDEGRTGACITRALLAVLTSLTSQIKILSGQIGKQLATHADQHVFTSLPRSGTVRAARLLAEIGDCRARFPTRSRCLPRRRRTLHPPIRQNPRRHVPLGLRQATPRRRHRLRRRLPDRQPLGRRPLTSAPALAATTTPTPARSTNPAVTRIRPAI